MKTINEAITERLAKKRIAREAKELSIQIEQKQLKDFEVHAENLFIHWLEKITDVVITNLDIEASYNSPHPEAIQIRIQFEDGHIVLNNPVQILNGDNKPLKPSEFDKSKTATKFNVLSLDHNNYWHSIYKQSYIDYEDFIDAVIYAKFGTPEPHDL